MTKGRRRILVIDDEPDIRESLAALLEDEGYDVTEATHGQHALELLRDGPLPDLALLDLMMPVMNGWDFRREQLADPRLAPIPVIVLSGAADGRREAQALGVADFAPKPTPLAKLLALIARHLR